MSTETTDLLNSGEVVESLGQAWTLSHVGPGIRGAFSSWLKGRARADLQQQRREGVLEGDDYREALANLNEEMAAGAYNWGSPLDPKGMGTAVRAALSQTEGKVKLVQLLLRAKHGEVEASRVLALMADNAEVVGEAIRVCVQGGSQAGESDPNGKRPE